MIPEKSRRTHRMGHISRGAARVTHAPRPCVMMNLDEERRRRRRVFRDDT
jgi:hypothetical protein